MHKKKAEEKVKEAMDKELEQPKKEVKKEEKKPAAVKKVEPEKKKVEPKKKAVPKKKVAKKSTKKSVKKSVIEPVKKEESLDDTISQVYDEIHSGNSTDTDSDGGGFIGQHMKKMAEKKKAEEEAKKLEAEKQWALDHPGFIAESNISTVLKHQKNHKKGILERVQEKIQVAEKEKADDDAGEIMEQALNDPSYVE